MLPMHPWGVQGDGNTNDGIAESSTASTSNSFGVTAGRNPSGLYRAEPDQASQTHDSIRSQNQTNPQSCQHCRTRKIKCDKILPQCSHCLRGKTTCIYPASQRKGRPRPSGTRQSSTAPAPPPSKEELLTQKVKRLEAVIESLKGGQERTQYDSDGDPVRQRIGQLVVGKPYINDTFWTSNELKDILHQVDESSDSEDDDSGFHQTAILRDYSSGSLNAPLPLMSNTPFKFHQSFVLEVDNCPVDLSSFHPSPPEIEILWQLYLQNCESLLRILHSPTVGLVVNQAITDPRALKNADELLLFAIYFAASVSVSDEDAIAKLGIQKSVLQERFEPLVRRALVNSGFLTTQDIVVLQGFVLYLICLRHSDGAVVWTLVGLALRIAEGIGLHRDGELYGLRPYETEIRRRVAAQLYILDTRAAEARGCLPTYLFYDTKLPSNINDSDFSPDSRTYPTNRHGLTDMTVSLIRTEVSEFSRQKLRPSPYQSNSDSSPAAKVKMIEDFHKEIQAKYVDIGDNSNPLLQFAAKIAVLIMQRMMLMVYQREHKEIPPETRERLFLTSINVIEVAQEIIMNPLGKQWSWLFKAYVQWHAVSFCLVELGRRSPSPETERAWRAIDSTFKDWSPPPDSMNNVLYESVQKLLLKARAYKARTTPDEMTPLPESSAPPAPFPLFEMSANYLHNPMAAAGAGVWTDESSLNTSISGPPLIYPYYSPAPSQLDPLAAWLYQAPPQNLETPFNADGAWPLWEDFPSGYQPQ